MTALYKQKKYKRKNCTSHTCTTVQGNSLRTVPRCPSLLPPPPPANTHLNPVGLTEIHWLVLLFFHSHPVEGDTRGVRVMGGCGGACACVYACVCICMYVCIHACVCVCVCVCDRQEGKCLESHIYYNS